MESRVDPELRPMLSAMMQEDFRKSELSIIREGIAAVFQRAAIPSGLCTISDKLVAGPVGAPEVRVRLYEPQDKKTPCPGILYIHGGGYILGSAQMTDASCAKMASVVGCVVASVDYRLAPEHPYPAALKDCYAALLWFSENAVTLGVDNTKIAVVGGSAGGGLAAALTLLARDRGEPQVAFQAPLYPMLDDRNQTASSREFTDPRIWSRDKNLFAWEQYLGPLYGDEEISAYAAPARAQDLSCLPPTYTFVGELDLFRDETITYVTRLLQAGVPTEFHIYPGCFHGFDMFLQSDVSRRAENALLEALKRALN